MKRALLTGPSGMLGAAFRSALQERFEIIAVGHDTLDTVTPNAIAELIERAKPDIVFNCAAHTNVEAAQQDPRVDYAANARLPRLLAEGCTEIGATMVHFSSTGCYGNWKETPYTEDDVLRPTTAHHSAKSEGEAGVRAAACRSLIFRMGWLYGAAPKTKKNFVWNRLIEAASVPQLKSDVSQRGCPTHVDDVVRQVLRVLDAGHAGTFNLTAHGVASRFEYVSEIVKASGLPCEVIPGPAFSRLAPVSENESAINQRLQQEGLDNMTGWRESLHDYVHKMLASIEWQSR